MEIVQWIWVLYVILYNRWSIHELDVMNWWVSHKLFCSFKSLFDITIKNIKSYLLDRISNKFNSYIPQHHSSEWRSASFWFHYQLNNNNYFVSILYSLYNPNQPFIFHNSFYALQKTIKFTPFSYWLLYLCLYPSSNKIPQTYSWKNHNFLAKWSNSSWISIFIGIQFQRKITFCSFPLYSTLYLYFILSQFNTQDNGQRTRLWSFCISSFLSKTIFL